jgi:hypothetical protein
VCRKRPLSCRKNKENSGKTICTHPKQFWWSKNHFGPIEGQVLCTYLGVLPVIKDNSSTLRVDSVASSYRKSSKVILLFDWVAAAKWGHKFVQTWFTFNEFIRCFHQFVSRIFSTNFSQFVQLKKKRNLLLFQNSFFFSVFQLKKKSW